MLRAARKVSKRKDLETWLHEETRCLERVFCIDCPDEWACNECGDGTVRDLAETDYHRRVVIYYISRKLREYGVGLNAVIPKEWEVSPEMLWSRVRIEDEGYEEDEDEWYEVYDKIIRDYELTAMPIETYELFGAKVFTVDFTVPEISDRVLNENLPGKEDILNAFRLGTTGMPRAEKRELLESYVCDPQDVKSFQYQKLYIIRFPGVARDRSFSWALGHDIVNRLWKIVKFPVMVTNYHDEVTLAGTDYVITSASLPNEYEEYRYMEYGENVFNYTGLAALFLLAVAHFYLEERREKWI